MDHIMETINRDLLHSVVAVAIGAGQEIMHVYNRDAQIEVDFKEDDSPITEADTRSHRLIVSSLQQMTPDIPVLSEESDAVPHSVRRRWPHYWLVDPLDGTREFISRNGEFTVNIALIRDGQAVLGVVHVPATGTTFSGIVDEGAWQRLRGAEEESIHARSLSGIRSLRVLASRRHGDDALKPLLDSLAMRFAEVEKVSMGSSLKICLLASGGADLYPRLAPTSEWDTAAAHAVLRAAGGEIYTTDCLPLTYNSKDSLLNPHFIAVGDPHFPWSEVVKGV
jgi:3'(2'), 5'-bisphosphate nucleotidase